MSNYLGIGVSPGNVPVYNGSINRMKVIERRLKVAELVLRCLICVFSVISALLIGFDSQVQEIFSLRKRAKFTDMGALVFLVVASALVAAYSVVQGSRCVVNMLRGSCVLFSKPLAWAVFSADQVMAYLMLVAVATAAQSALLAKFGESDFQWMQICKLYDKFCNQIGEGIASGLFATIGMIILSPISAFSLFRLYSPTLSKQK